MASFMAVKVEGGKKFQENANAAIRKTWTRHLTNLVKDFHDLLMKVAPMGQTGNYRKGQKVRYQKGDTPRWGKVQSYRPAYHSHLVEFGTKDRFNKRGAYRGRMKPTLAGSSNIGLQGPYFYTRSRMEGRVQSLTSQIEAEIGREFESYGD
jgi:hypothetical protein